MAGIHGATRKARHARRLRAALAALLLLGGAAAAVGPAPQMDGLPPTFDDETLIARPTAAVPSVDGVAEPLWDGAHSLEVIVTGASGNLLAGNGIRISAFHNTSWMFFLVTWPDATQDRGLDAWRLTDNSTPEGTWTRTGWGQDTLAFYFDDGRGAERNFSAVGCSAICHTGPNQMHTTSSGFVDLWHWTAGRSDPLGIAADRYLDNATKQGGSPTGGFHEDAVEPWYENGVSTAFGPRPGFLNASAPASATHIADADKQAIDWSSFDSGSLANGTVVPAWVLAAPQPGEGDVLAAATHNGSGWTLEMARPFITGDNGSRDVPVSDLGDVYYFSVAMTNNLTGENHSLPLLANKLVFAGNLLPDYTVPSATPATGSVAVGARANVSVLLRNNGFTDGTQPVDVTVVHASNLTEVARAGTGALGWGMERVVFLEFDTTGWTPGNYSMAVVADADDMTSESNETNNGRPFVLAVTAAPVFPDLVLTNVSGPAEPVFAPEAAVLTGTVTNRGDADSGGDVVVRAAHAAFPVTDLNVGPLAAGASVDFVLNASTAGVPSGSYFVAVTVDPQNAVDEGSEGEANNTAPAVVTVEARPDLEPVGLVLFPAAAMAGDTTELNVTIANHGAAFSGDIEVWTYLDNATSTGSNDRVLVWTATVTLARDAFTYVTTPWQVPPGLPAAPNHSVRVWLDGPRALDEGVEDNNNRSAALAVLEAPRPDLTIVSGSVDRAAYAAGELATVRVNVTNTGAAYTRSVVLEVTDDATSAALANVTVPAVAPGATQEVTAAFTVPSGPAGPRSVTVFIDAADILPEASEFNNSMGLSYTLLPAVFQDLTVTDLRATPAAPVAGQTVQLVADIVNQGTQATPGTSGSFRLGATLLGFGSVPALAPAGGTSIAFAWDTTGFTGLQALLSFAVDPNGTVDESDESNNAATLTLVFSRPGSAIFELAPLAVAPRNATSGDLVRVEATVENTGSAPGTVTVRVTLEGEMLAQATFDLQAGENRTLSANWTANGTGSRVFRAEALLGPNIVDVANGQVNVAAPPGEPVEDASWTLWVGVLALVGVGALMYLRMRAPPRGGGKDEAQETD